MEQPVTPKGASTATPTDLVSVMDLPLMASCKSRYQAAVKCGHQFAGGADAENHTLVDDLREIRIA